MISLKSFVRSASLRIALPALLIFAAAHRGFAGEIATGFVDRTIDDETGTHRYKVFVPRDYSPDRQWPVIMYLHGASARGVDNELPTLDSFAPHIRQRADRFPFIVVFPQCEDREACGFDGWLAHTPDARRAIKILDAVENDYSVDRHREILTGPSMGAYGAWSLAAKYPSRWAGVLIISGLGEPKYAPTVKDVPFCVFHGTSDLVVPIAEQRKMIEAVRAAGGKPLYTELVGARHVIAHLVYSDDRVYQWMLDPATRPTFDEMQANSKRPAEQAELGFDINTQFVPGAEIPQAAYVRINRNALAAVGYGIPDMLPQESLSRILADVEQSKRVVGMRFDVRMAGLSYQCHIERVEFIPSDDGWLTMRLGLRDMHMQIAQTQIDGRLMSATAGPMDVVVGHRGPVWLETALRPYVENRELKFQTGRTRFHIPNDNFHVSTPSVETRTIPGIRRRISGRISENLVNGAYERKPEIEQQVIASVPTLVQKLQTQVATKLSEPKTVHGWPMPAEQPRYKLWPSAIKVDRTGMTLIAGMTISRPGLHPSTAPAVIIANRKMEFSAIPGVSDIQMGFSGEVFQGLTTVMMEAGVRSTDVRDLHPIVFNELGNPESMRRAIPDLARYGNGLQVRTRVAMSEPGTQVAAPDLDPPGSGPLSMHSRITLEKMQLTVQIKTPETSGWQNCAVVDMSLEQVVKAQVERPSHEKRGMTMTPAAAAMVSASGRFVDGYRPLDNKVDANMIAAMFTYGWENGGQFELMKNVDVPDIAIGNVHMRLNRFGFHEQFTFRGFDLAPTRVTNSTDGPIQYYIRGPATGWKRPTILQPGQSHEYPVPYPLTVRRWIDGNDVDESIAAGMSAEFANRTANDRTALLPAPEMGEPALQPN